MDDHDQNAPPAKTSLTTFGRTIPVEIAALPASTRTSFTRVDNNTRPGTAAGDNDSRDTAAGIVPDVDGPGPGNGGAGDGVEDARAPSSPGDKRAEEKKVGGGGGGEGQGEGEGGGASRGVVEGADEAASMATVPQVPQTLLQFLLVSGRRRSMAFEPETTVGRVKELVWNSWPNDWQDERPPAPSFLRVLYLGKILQDEDTLTKLKFPSYTTPEPATPTIVHLSIRSFMPKEDTSLKKKRRMSRSGARTDAATSQDEHEGGCCCIVC